MAGYDQKHLELSQQSKKAVTFQTQKDITGTGLWKTYKQIEVPPGETKHYRFPDSFSAYWVRFVSDSDCVATAQLQYR